MALEPLLIRADASPDIGTGHVMRCLALAEAWQDSGGKVFFVISCDSPALEVRLRNEGIQIFHINQKAGTLGDANETARIAHELRADWIVVDGYQFGAEYQKTIKDCGLSLLFIDDYGHADHYYADIVLNQNIYADMSFYKKYEPNTRLLLGTKYALIRKEFLKYSSWHRDIPETARKILVTLGGSDPDNVTLKVIKAVETVDIDGLEVIVVSGVANPHFDLIHETVKDLSNFTLIKNAENMSELMAWVDIAISAGGSTCLELAYLGTPFIALFIADNQKPVVQGFTAQNAAVNLGSGQLLTKKEISDMLKKVIKSIDLRSNLSKNSKKLVDGEGVSRVIMNINSDPIRLITVRQSDCATLWKWANNPIVRKSAFNTEYISIEEHKSWFFQKINDSNCYFFIGLDAYDSPVGQIRFDLDGDIATVDISIDKKWRGKGFAKSLLNQGIQKLLKLCNVTTLKAYIKKENIDSIKTFMACNFEFSENKIIKNSEAIVLSRKLP
jgi:UDP-2,4-diacetamido-2,4,6-trideoxy-beta-L-altropyranose hydrolase